MRYSKPVRLETVPTGGESIYLFLEFTITAFRCRNYLVAMKRQQNPVRF